MALRVESDTPVTTVILDRPEARNAINPDTAQELKDAFAEFEADAEQKVAVLWGDGGTFCAGYDLKAVSAGNLQHVYEAEGEPALGISRSFLSKPVIAAVEGYAVAGGLELALWCDMRVVAEDAQLGVFCRRWGVPLIDGGTVRLPRLIGMSRALDLILTGRAVGGEEALAMGLGNRLAASGETRPVAEQLAREISRFPQTCMRTDRRSAYEQWDLTLEEALRNEGRLGVEPLMHEAAAGAARFAAGAGRGGSFEDA